MVNVAGNAGVTIGAGVGRGFTGQRRASLRRTWRGRAAAVWFGFGMNFAFAAAQSEALPPIFAPRVEIPAVSPAPARSVSLLSERMRNIIVEAALAEPSVAEVPLGSGASDDSFKRRLIADSFGPSPVGGAVVMQRMIVKSSSLRLSELPRADSPLLKFLKTGTLYHHVGRKFTTDISLNFLPVEARGYGRRETGTMMELRFNFSW